MGDNDNPVVLLDFAMKEVSIYLLLCKLIQKEIV